LKHIFVLYALWLEFHRQGKSDLVEKASINPIATSDLPVSSFDRASRSEWISYHGRLDGLSLLHEKVALSPPNTNGCILSRSDTPVDMRRQLCGSPIARRIAFASSLRDPHLFRYKD